MANKDKPLPDDELDTPTILDRLTTAIEALAKRQDVAPDADLSGIMDRLSTALERVSEAQVEGAKLIASETRRAHRPSNEVVPQISVYNRRGEKDFPKPPLKCLMMLPWLAEWESLTREEIQLLNLLEPGEYRMRRIDNSVVMVHIEVTMNYDGTKPSRLLLNHDTAFNNDNFRLVPPLNDFLRSLLKQHPSAIAEAARQVMSDEEEAMLIEMGDLSVSV